MTQFYINVGLQANGRDIRPADARAVLRACGLPIVQSNVLCSDSEPTLIAIVQVEQFVLEAAINNVCEALDQDCIAVMDMTTRQGRLIGPRAAAWGTFNPAYFLTLTGRRLNEAAKAAAADVYQGHLPGSGVQVHLAGGLFPWVIVAKGADTVRYGFIAPDGYCSPCDMTYEQAATAALAHMRLYANRNF